jgi:hypothetical protein
LAAKYHATGNVVSFLKNVVAEHSPRNVCLMIIFVNPPHSENLQLTHSPQQIFWQFVMSEK